MKKFISLLILFLGIVFSASSEVTLVGEIHGIDDIYKEELNLYRKFYNAGGRHYFMEVGHNTAELLNFWIQTGEDIVLDTVFSNWKGTLMGEEVTYNYLHTFKEEFPETVFHGIDVEHQYETNGKIYMNFLEHNNLTDTNEYLIASENMEQGMKYTLKKGSKDKYREKCLTENFIREYESINGKDVFGIFGSEHTSKDKKRLGTIPTLGMNLEKNGIHYKEIDLTNLGWLSEPFEYVILRFNGHNFYAAYYGTQSLVGFKNFVSRSFYELIDTDIEALKSFGKKYKKTLNYLPQSNYPMLLKPGTVYVLDYLMDDGSVICEIHICEGKTKNGDLVTYQIK
ncbi:MAG: hypothetical protein MJ181_07385 [Treponema sp.]|nr:hypothetical protein [Treponema sp.]